MKKIIFLLGIVAIMAACSGNKPSKESTEQEGTEMQQEGTDNTTESVDTTTIEAPVDTTATPAAE